MCEIEVFARKYFNNHYSFKLFMVLYAYWLKYKYSAKFNIRVLSFITISLEMIFDYYHDIKRMLWYYHIMIVYNVDNDAPEHIYKGVQKDGLSLGGQ